MFFISCSCKFLRQRASTAQAGLTARKWQDEGVEAPGLGSLLLASWFSCIGSVCGSCPMTHANLEKCLGLAGSGLAPGLTQLTNPTRARKMVTWFEQRLATASRPLPASRTSSPSQIISVPPLLQRLCSWSLFAPTRRHGLSRGFVCPFWRDIYRGVVGQLLPAADAQLRAQVDVRDHGRLSADQLPGYAACSYYCVFNYIQRIDMQQASPPTWSPTWPSTTRPSSVLSMPPATRG